MKLTKTLQIVVLSIAGVGTVCVKSAVMSLEFSPTLTIQGVTAIVTLFKERLI